MTAKIIISHLFFFTTTLNFSMHLINLQKMDTLELIKNKKKHIIFDAEFIIQTDQGKAFKKLGISSLSALTSGVLNREESFKELLLSVEEGMKNYEESIQEQEYAETVYLENQKTPQAMVCWLKNKINSAVILDKVTSYIKKKYTLSQRPTTIATLAFDPEECVEVLTINPEAQEIISELTKQGNVVHILGNWNSIMREKFTEHFSEDLKIINGKILVSGDLGEVKCTEHAKIYDKFLEKVKVLPKNACFIETWKTHTPESISTIIAKPTDLESIKQELQNRGFLKK